MLYALDKNPEVLTKLAELANTHFLSGEADDDTADSDDSDAVVRAIESKFDDDSVIVKENDKNTKDLTWEWAI